MDDAMRTDDDDDKLPERRELARVIAASFFGFQVFCASSAPILPTGDSECGRLENARCELRWGPHDS